MLGGQQTIEQHAREDQAADHGHSNWSIALRSPIARTSSGSCVAAPPSATGRSEEPARAGRKFVMNRHRRTNRTGFCDVSPEFHKIGMGHDAVGNIDGEVVTGIA